jgi:DNA-binding transcriptional MerR regulator
VTAILSIGQVLRRLRNDFPDVSISKIRFLEAEGLVTPERAPSGYRKFSEHDVDRLRFVLRAQRDHYLPLRVIKDRLSAADRGLPPGLGDAGPADGAAPVPAPALVDPVALVGTTEFSTSEAFEPDLSPGGALRLTKSELLAEAGIDDAVFEQLQTFRLIPPAVAGYFGADAVTIARTAGSLASYGLEPRHLRSFKMAADREVGLFEQVLIPLRQRDSQAAGAALNDLSMLSVRLHALLVRSALAGTTLAR